MNSNVIATGSGKILKNQHMLPITGSTVVVGMLSNSIYTQTPKEYIQDVLINQIGEIVKVHKYLSNILISSGIEFLGACLDGQSNIFDENRSKDRFKDAIVKLFPQTYHTFNTENSPFFLYKSFRCGLLHVTLPQTNLVLSEKNHGQTHLSINNSKLYLVAEDFYEDFKNACNEVIRKIDRNEINPKFSLVAV